jgi:hypothetical protein
VGLSFFLFILNVAMNRKVDNDMIERTYSVLSIVIMVLCIIALSLAIFLLSSVLGQQAELTGSEFAVVQLTEQPGEQITEVISYEMYPGLDNSDGTTTAPVEVELIRDFNYQIIEIIDGEGVSNERVREEIVELYKLPPVNPEDVPQEALCPTVVPIPAGTRAAITVEWTEVWAEGVINEGVNGEGRRLGTYRVFLGYAEPCSLIAQENIP